MYVEEHFTCNAQTYTVRSLASSNADNRSTSPSLKSNSAFSSLSYTNKSDCEWLMGTYSLAASKWLFMIDKCSKLGGLG